MHDRLLITGYCVEPASYTPVSAGMGADTLLSDWWLLFNRALECMQPISYTFPYMSAEYY